MLDPDETSVAAARRVTTWLMVALVIVSIDSAAKAAGPRATPVTADRIVHAYGRVRPIVSTSQLSTAKHQFFKAIVYDGVIHSAGMPQLSDLVTEQDVHDIQAYIVERAKQDRAAMAAARAK
jgi:hypothetical protein